MHIHKTGKQRFCYFQLFRDIITAKKMENWVENCLPCSGIKNGGC